MWKRRHVINRQHKPCCCCCCCGCFPSPVRISLGQTPAPDQFSTKRTNVKFGSSGSWMAPIDTCRHGRTATPLKGYAVAPGEAQILQSGTMCTARRTRLCLMCSRIWIEVKSCTACGGGSDAVVKRHAPAEHRHAALSGETSVSGCSPVRRTMEKVRGCACLFVGRGTHSVWGRGIAIACCGGSLETLFCLWSERLKSSCALIYAKTCAYIMYIITRLN